MGFILLPTRCENIFVWPPEIFGSMSTMKCLAILLLGIAASLRAQTPVSLAEVAADPKIWPVEVMVTVDHKLPVVIDGKTAKTLKVGPGKIYRVKGITDSGVSVQGLGSLMVFKEDETDVLARAGQVRAQLAALAAATPTPAPTPNRDVLPANSRHPFALDLPPGFIGPQILTKDILTIYSYSRVKKDERSAASIQIYALPLPAQASAMTIDQLLPAFLEGVSESAPGLRLGKPVEGLLGALPARQIPLVLANQNGKMTGALFVTLHANTLYGAIITDFERAAVQSLPELRAALATLRFSGVDPNAALASENHSLTPVSAGEGSQSRMPKPGALHLPKAKNLASQLSDMLVLCRDGQFRPYEGGDLSQKKYLVVYFSGAWCPASNTFTPILISWYQDRKKRNDIFEVVFVSFDRSEGFMRAHMEAAGMEWPAVAFSRGPTSPLAKYAGRSIPCIVILDRNGRVMASSASADTHVSPLQPLQELDKLLGIR
jgi:hypothetical protein